jgi:hypothetical protein
MANTYYIKKFDKTPVKELHIITRSTRSTKKLTRNTTKEEKITNIPFPRERRVELEVEENSEEKNYQHESKNLSLRTISQLG